MSVSQWKLAAWWIFLIFLHCNQRHSSYIYKDKLLKKTGHLFQSCTNNQRSHQTLSKNGGHSESQLHSSFQDTVLQTSSTTEIREPWTATHIIDLTHALHTLRKKTAQQTRMVGCYHKLFTRLGTLPKLNTTLPENWVH